MLTLLFFRGAGGSLPPPGGALLPMTARQEFGAKTVNETRQLTFDFSSFLGSAEVISLAVANCAVWSGTDASPTSVLSGATAISGGLVTQLVTGGVAGVIYVVQMVATTSIGQILTISGFLAVVPGQPG